MVQVFAYMVSALHTKETLLVQGTSIPRLTNGAYRKTSEDAT